MTRLVAAGEGQARDAEGLNGARRSHMRDTMRADSTELSCGAEVRSSASPVKFPGWRNPGLQK